MKPFYNVQEETTSEVSTINELAKKWESSMFKSDQPAKYYVVKNVCRDMDLSDDETPRIIKIYEKITKDEWKFWKYFFKKNTKVFAWSYKGWKWASFILSHIVIGYHLLS